MNKILLFALFLLLTTHSQAQQQLFKIKYGLSVSQEMKDLLQKADSTSELSDEQMALAFALAFAGDGDPVIEATFNRDFIRVQNTKLTESVEISDIKKQQSYLLYPSYKSYAEKDFFADKVVLTGATDDELSAAATADFPITYDDKSTKVIQGMICHKATIEIGVPEGVDMGGFDPKVDIWYSKDLPPLFWGEYSYLRKLPGAALNISTNGIGIEAMSVSKQPYDATLFTIPADYEKQEAVDPLLQAWSDSLVNLYDDSEGDTLYLNESLFVFQDTISKLYGVRDLDGKEVIPANYTSMTPTEGDILIVSDSDVKYGALDFAGNTIIPIQFESLTWTAEGPIAYSENFLYGYLQRDGSPLIPAQYQYAAPFTGAYATVMKDSKTGIINLQNEVVAPFVYETIVQIVDDFFVASTDVKFSLHQLGQQAPVLSDYDYLELGTENKMVVAAKDEKYGFVDRSGKVLIPFTYQFASSFSNGIAYVINDKGENAYINEKGEEVQLEETE